MKTMDRDVMLKTAHRKIQEISNESSYQEKSVFNLEWMEETGKMKVSSPSRITVNAIATDIRHFIAPNSPILLKRIIQNLEPGLDEIQLKEITKLRKDWNDALKAHPSKTIGIALELNGEEINNAQVINLINNGEVFHTDEKNIEMLALLRNTPMFGLLQANFVLIMQKLISILEYLDKAYIENYLAKENENRDVEKA